MVFWQLCNSYGDVVSYFGRLFFDKIKTKLKERKYV